VIEIGYALSSEEHKPNDLVAYGREAEESGFTFALISDHYHPWTNRQGNSPFVWSVLGALAHATNRIRIGSGVTCPIMRLHPAIIAQAAATVAAMMPGRFFLGVGTGEYLNEHILGDPWPEPDTRLEMLAEAVEIIRELWQGNRFNHDGVYFKVRDARIYTLPKDSPPILMAASGDKAALMAGEIADGLISLEHGPEIVAEFRNSGGNGQPCIGQVTACWADSVKEAELTVREWWPISSLSGSLHVDLPTPEHFEDVIELMDEPAIPDDIVLGPDAGKYLEVIESLAGFGYDQIYIHQIGPEQSGFLEFFRDSLHPLLADEKLIATPNRRHRQKARAKGLA
jgi:G6PDH family F420-dependent oxidoreductase